MNQLNWNSFSYFILLLLIINYLREIKNESSYEIVNVKACNQCFIIILLFVILNLDNKIYYLYNRIKP